MKIHTGLTYLKMISQTRKSPWRFLNDLMQQFEGCVGREEVWVQVSLCKTSGTGWAALEPGGDNRDLGEFAQRHIPCNATPQFLIYKGRVRNPIVTYPLESSKQQSTMSISRLGGLKSQPCSSLAEYPCTSCWTLRASVSPSVEWNLRRYLLHRLVQRFMKCMHPKISIQCIVNAM